MCSVTIYFFIYSHNSLKKNADNFKMTLYQSIHHGAAMHRLTNESPIRDGPFRYQMNLSTIHLCILYLGYFYFSFLLAEKLGSYRQHYFILSLMKRYHTTRLKTMVLFKTFMERLQSPNLLSMSQQYCTLICSQQLHDKFHQWEYIIAPEPEYIFFVTAILYSYVSTAVTWLV